MGNTMGLVSKFQELSNYAVDHGLVTDPGFNSIRISYSEWYQSYEDDGTKVPQEGMSKYTAGIIIYQQIDEQLTKWEVTAMKNEVITQEEVDALLGITKSESNEVQECKVPLSAKIIVGTTIVGYATGKALNTVATKVISPAAKATGHYLATDGKNGCVTVGQATKAGLKAFWAGLKNK